jgi:hypothetical protein
MERSPASSRVGPSFSDQIVVTLSRWTRGLTRVGLSGRMREVGWGYEANWDCVDPGPRRLRFSCCSFILFPPRLVLAALVLWRWGGAFWRWWRRSWGTRAGGAAVVPISAGGGGGSGVVAPAVPCRWADPASLLSAAVLAGEGGGRGAGVLAPAPCGGLFSSFSVCSLVDHILPVRCSIRGSCPQMRSL